MQVFNSHTVQDPIIHNAADSCEDLSTAIASTRESLMAVFEILERIAAESPTDSLINRRVLAADNYLHIADERLAAHSGMAYAIYQKIGGEGAQPVGSTIKRHTDRLRWCDAIEAFKRELRVEQAMTGATEEEVSEQSEKTLARYHAMLQQRAPSLREAHRKVLLVRDFEKGSPLSAEAWQSISDDMEALAEA